MSGAIVATRALRSLALGNWACADCGLECHGDNLGICQTCFELDLCIAPTDAEHPILVAQIPTYAKALERGLVILGIDWGSGRYPEQWPPRRHGQNELAVFA